MKAVKKALAVVIGFCIMICICPWTTAMVFADSHFSGKGTEDSPYLISTKLDLLWLSELINDPDTVSEYNGKYYKQTNDIDLGNEPFTPIGDYRNESTKSAFSGIYDGCYFTITGLYVTKQPNRAGLFSLLTGTVKNLSVYGNIESDGNEMGGIAGNTHSGTILNCSFNGTIKGKAKNIGGIVGSVWREANIENCYFNGTIKSNNSEAKVGGISGDVTAGYDVNIQHVYIENCYATGTIIADDNANLGGITGNYSFSNDDSTITFKNNYYLSIMTTGAVNGKNEKGCTKFAEKALKACSENLGSPFTDNNRTDGFNDGYPIFEWQAEPYRFNGTGTDSDPYVISSKEELIAMRDMVNSAFFNGKYGSASYILTSDIDLANEVWTPIGTGNDDSNGFQPVFCGRFDGNMHTISNLTVNESSPYSGLFGKLGTTSKPGRINSINITGKVNSSSDYVGGICGEISYGSSITDSAFAGTVTGIKYVGGVAGACQYSGTISNCYTNGKITAESCAGGLLGVSLKAGDDGYNVTVKNCYHIGDVSAENSAHVIGFSEINGNKSTTVEILNCYYLKDCKAVNGECTTLDVNPTPANLLKYVAEDLGSAFSTNTDNNFNNGYPVLAWQVESKTIGDVNNDGKISIVDAVLLQNHLLNRVPLTVNRTHAADINQDGTIDVFDMILMKKLLLSQPHEYTEWSTDVPPSDAVDVESRVEYRYASKTYKTSETQLSSPWILEDTKTEYGEWGNWSDYSETKVEESDNRKVETTIEQRQSLSGYNMFEYCTRDPYSYDRWYRNYSIAGSLGAYGADTQYGEHSSFLWGTGFVASQSELDSATRIAPGTWFTGTQGGINKGDVDGYYIASHPDVLWFKGDAVYNNYDETLYRYCDRTKKTIYTYYQLSDYSKWSTTSVESSNDVIVETRTVYRYIPTA